MAGKSQKNNKDNSNLLNSLINNEEDQEEARTPPLETPLAPCSSQQMQEAASACTQLAMEALEGIIRDTSKKDADRIAASIALLDRGHGKPGQVVTVRNTDHILIEHHRRVFGSQVVIEGQTLFCEAPIENGKDNLG